MTRANARELAVHLIYGRDFTREDPEEVVSIRLDKDYYAHLSQENEVYAERPSRKQMTYIRACVEGVTEHQQELDEYIAQFSIGWNVHRLSRFTKAALRLAIFESLYIEDVPVGVAINECVMLTRKYEDEEVVAFVNGVLGAFARSLKEKEQ